MRMNLWFTESKLEDCTFMYDLVIELFYQEVCFLHKELIKGWYINSQYMPQYSSEKNQYNGKEKVIFTLPQLILNIYNVYVLVNLCKLKAGKNLCLYWHYWSSTVPGPYFG